MTTASSPTELAGTLLPILDRALVVFDVDGVLAPIVEHADDAVLTPGVLDDLSLLSDRTTVGILSGRSLESLERLFAFPPGMHVVGSHGLEERDGSPMALDPAEQARFEALERIGRRAVDDCGDGAWLERKPASVVIHTRSAHPDNGNRVVERARREAAEVDGAVVKGGREVLELLARSASKGDALLGLARRLDRSPLVYLGDDLTDEDAFEVMAEHDISVRIGDGETAARYRLPDPGAVRELLAALVGR